MRWHGPAVSTPQASSAVIGSDREAYPSAVRISEINPGDFKHVTTFDDTVRVQSAVMFRLPLYAPRGYERRRMPWLLGVWSYWTERIERARLDPAALGGVRAGAMTTRGQHERGTFLQDFLGQLLNGSRSLG